MKTNQVSVEHERVTKEIPLNDFDHVYDELRDSEDSEDDNLESEDCIQMFCQFFS